MVLRMATELGVTRLIPLAARRSVVREARFDRWERVMRAAAGQCGRSTLPAISPLADSLEDAMQGIPVGVARRMLVPGGPVVVRSEGPLVLMAGPEGGWTPDEVHEAVAADFQPVGLGTLTLRADTAAIAGLAALAPILER